MTKVLVLIPAYNESERIAEVVKSVHSIVPDFDILVVNDCSRDNTAEAAEEAGAMVLRLPFNLGYGAALQSGFKFALRKGYEYVVQMDADGQHPAKYIRDLVEPVIQGVADVAIGSRFVRDTGYRMPFAKMIGVLIFSNIVSLVTGKTVKDPTSGFQALNRKVLKLYVSDAYPVDFPDADVLIMLHKRGFQFLEVPVEMRPNPKQKTMHGGITTLYYIFKMFLSILVTLLRKESGGNGR